MTEEDDAHTGDEGFRDYLRHQEVVLLAEARKQDYIRHRPSVGVGREEVLRSALRGILPPRYELTTGVVKASDGATSSQWDILVYDRLDTPLLHGARAATVLPVEGVLAAISVKSSLDDRAVHDAAEAASTLRQLKQRPLRPSLAPGEEVRLPAVYLFGFEGLELPTLYRHVLEACVEPGSPSVLNGVCCLGKGLITPRSPDNELAGPAEYIDSYGVALSPDGAYGIFVGLLWSTLIMTPKTKPNLLSYIRMGELLDKEAVEAAIAAQQEDARAEGQEDPPPAQRGEEEPGGAG